MGGERQKALLPILGTPMVRHVAVAVAAAKPDKTVAVVGFDADAVVDFLSTDDALGAVEFVRQNRQSGTGHALSCAFELISRKRGDALVINGDMPAVTGSLIKRLVSSHRKSGAAVSFATAFAPNPDGYGRVVRGGDGEPAKIVEHPDATDRQKKIREVNAGIYCFKMSFLRGALAGLKKKNAKGEYYITDLVEAALLKSEKVGTVKSADFGEVAGVNTPAEISAVGSYMRERVNSRLMRLGVVIYDPATSYICPETKIGGATVIHPCSFINRSKIGANCVIGPGTHITNSSLAAGCRVEFSSMLDGCVMRSGSAVGPFARLRPETVLMEDSKAGAFVEIKKSSVGRNSKIPHLSYVGDSELGAGVNIGAGTVTCNYDGVRKHRTTVEDGAFIGSDTMLVAPVRVGKNAVTAAGSVITSDVSPRALAIGRSRQREIAEWNRSKKRTKKRLMCGIVGYLGFPEKTCDVVCGGLEKLDSRGYDSAGICLVGKDGAKVFKSPGEDKPACRKTGFPFSPRAMSE